MFPNKHAIVNKIFNRSLINKTKDEQVLHISKFLQEFSVIFYNRDPLIYYLRYHIPEIKAELYGNFENVINAILLVFGMENSADKKILKTSFMKICQIFEKKIETISKDSINLDGFVIIKLHEFHSEMYKKSKQYNIDNWILEDLQNIVVSACANSNILTFSIAESFNNMFYLNKIDYTYSEKFPKVYYKDKLHNWIHKIGTTNIIHIVIKLSHLDDFIKFKPIKDIKIDLEIISEDEKKNKVTEDKIRKIYETFIINKLILPKQIDKQPIIENNFKFAWE